MKNLKDTSRLQITLLYNLDLSNEQFDIVMIDLEENICKKVPSKRKSQAKDSMSTYTLESKAFEGSRT